MITRSQLRPVGEFLKPHGIKGELSATIETGVSLGADSCLVVDIDGLFVPFFVVSTRRRGPEAILLTIDGINDDSEAKTLARKTIFMRADDPALAAIDEDDDNEDGFYASDLIGYKILDRTSDEIGIIEDIDDSTDNTLFIVRRPGEATEVMIPVADEFIESIDPDEATITMVLPDGLL